MSPCQDNAVAAKIREIGDHIQNKLNVVVCYENAERGRQGRRCYVNPNKVGIRGMEVVALKGIPHIGFDLENEAEWQKKVSEWKPKFEGEEIDSAEKFKIHLHKLLTRNQLNRTKNQKNPRYGEYSFENFKLAFEVVSEHIPDKEGLGRATKLFKRSYEPKKIAERYAYAIENQDQPLLDLCRSLLDADKFDAHIAVNRMVEPYKEREHVVPCVAIHNHLIDMFYDQDKKAIRQEKDEIIKEASALIDKYLLIAYISKEEREAIDKNYKTEMPEGWKFNGNHSIYARFICSALTIRNGFEAFLEEGFEGYEGREPQGFANAAGQDEAGTLTLNRAR